MVNKDEKIKSLREQVTRLDEFKESIMANIMGFIGMYNSIESGELKGDKNVLRGVIMTKFINNTREIYNKSNEKQE